VALAKKIGTKSGTGANRRITDFALRIPKKNYLLDVEINSARQMCYATPGY